MFVEFNTTNNIRVQVLEVQLVLGKIAFVQCYCFLPTGLNLAKLEMNEEEYAQWGSDDNYVKHWICSKLPLLGTVTDSDINQTPIITSDINSDSRSVHNPTDLETINNLKSQLDQQQAKIDQINKLLLSRGIL